MTRLGLGWVAGLLAGCHRLPEAPAEFRDQCAWVFEHAWDDDPEALVAGLDRMHDWLATEWDPEADADGFVVDAPSEEAMDALDEEDRTSAGMVGIALPTASTHAPADAAEALMAVPQDEVFPDTFSDYERTWLSGPDCFLDRTCDRAEAMEHMVSDFGIAGTTESDAHNQYMWGPASAGDALVHRNWLVDPPVTTGLIPGVDQQAYLDVFLPADGGSWRVQAQWTLYEGDIPEGTAQTLVVHFFESSSEELEAWMDAQR